MINLEYEEGRRSNLVAMHVRQPINDEIATLRSQ
jgi:hypothetical protein